jgi:ATP-dependent DNA ligase
MPPVRSRHFAHISNGTGELVSRDGDVFRGFAELATWISEHLKVQNAVLDGEIACIDGEGRPSLQRSALQKIQLCSRRVCLPA